MKANLIRRIAIAICLVSCISIYSCKKDQSASSDTTTSNLTTTGDDQEQVSNEADLIVSDANTALNGQSDFSGSLSSSSSLSGTTVVNDVNGTANVNGLVNVHHLICDATVTYDTSNNQRVITIVYDGTNCWGNRTRYRNGYHFDAGWSALEGPGCYRNHHGGCADDHTHQRW